MTCRRCDKPAHTRGFCGPHYRYMLHTGRFGYVDAGPAREHVLLLRSLGWTYEQMAEAAGTANWTPNHLARGTIRRTLPETSRAILAIEAAPVPSHRGVSGTGTYRRIEALQWLGWPLAEIGTQAGLRPYTLCTLRSRNEPVSHRVALAIAELYEELSHLPGPSKQTATKARNRGYAPPMAWDDIDNPRERPKGVAA